MAPVASRIRRTARDADDATAETFDDPMVFWQRQIVVDCGEICLADHQCGQARAVTIGCSGLRRSDSAAARMPAGRPRR
jgi:hypothetical protein